MNHFALAAAATAIVIGVGAAQLTATSANAPKAISDAANPMIDGQAMPAGLDLADNITVSPEHTVLTVYLKETDRDQALKQKGPLTLFAPTDKAFMTAGNLGSRADLTRLVDYHLVRGKFDYKALLALIGQAGGRAKLTTVSGGTLVASLNGARNIQLMDENGGTANIAIYDIYSRNGVLQVIDRVMKPTGFDNRRPVLTSQAQ
jgi:uncharacterized surface protein with fasciclin (FAS1) repeats